MQGIKTDLKKFLAKSGFLQKYYEEKAISCWEKVAGKEIANNCRPQKILG